MLTSEKIEKSFIDLLQCNVKATCGNKVLKQGKLLLVSKKNATICLMITNQKNEPKNYELPYPFGITYDESNMSIILDYTIPVLCNGKSCIIDEITALIPQKPSRFLNKQIHITSVD